MRRYNAYNPSPVIWNTEFPTGWKFIRGKNLYKKENRPTRNFDKVVTCFRDGQVTLRENRRTTGFTESIKEIGYQGIRKGDLVIHVMDAFAGAIGVSDSDGKGSPIYSVCTAKQDVNNYYYAYLLREVARNGYIKSLYRGIRERSSDFRFEVFANEFYPVPPRAEQDQIVRFLDWKVSEINKLIGIRRKEIKELEKLCWIVIVNAISKVKQKNISEWKRVRVKRICRMQSGTNLISQVIDQSGNYPVYGGNGLRGYYKNYTNDGQYVIIGRQGALAGNVHLVEGRFWATDHAIVVYCSKFLIPRYAYYLFTGMNLNQYAFNTAAQPGLSVTKILNLQCDVPSVARQLEIADRLDEICVQLEKIVNNTKKKIKSLQELKSVIISDVVTGKIDVRNIPVPAYEHVDDMGDDAGEDNDEETGIPGEED